MNNTNPFQASNPFNAQAAGLPSLTLSTHLSPLGLGRQAVPAASDALTFRRSA